MPTLRARELQFIVAVQATRPAQLLVRPAQALGVFGENAVGWILLGLLGAALDRDHLAAWLLSLLTVIVAHLLAAGIKRLVRRPRPGAVPRADGSFDLGVHSPYTAGARGPVVVHAKAPSRLSFPSSHAASTSAAVVAYTAFFPALWPIAVIVLLAMGASRIVLGMHFPSDVLAGYALGLVVAAPVVLLAH